MTKSKRRSSGGFIRRWFLRLSVMFLIVAGLWTVWLDYRVRSEFEGNRWTLPARVFARPLELYAGLHLTPDQLVQELSLQRYRVNPQLSQPGQYIRTANRVRVYTRGFQFAHLGESENKLEIIFSDDRVQSLRSLSDGREYDLWSLAPLLIANIYPLHNEDRILVQLDDVPKSLIAGLLAVEDRDFYTHFGINPKSLARAVLANIKAGKTVQGGSTITQQLVKNYFLNDDRSLWRKANEAIMAMLLEAHYDKDEILQAYMNEIYLGQSGEQAIHGFGLASQFYFQKELSTLNHQEVALLIALVRGASWYDPRRNPARAIERRNLVLSLMAEHEVISSQQAKRAQQTGLGVAKHRPTASTPFPAFLDLVREQLKRDYSEDDLRSQGLFIFTTLDPLAQQAAEESLNNTLKTIERQRGMKSGSAEAALVAADVNTAEVLAVVGGRQLRLHGFNRALNARRPIGSLVKPAVYLTALSTGDYALNTLLIDQPISVPLDDNKQWVPQNYDKEFRGEVLMQNALVESLNVPTAALGLQVGLRPIAQQISALAGVKGIPELPSMLLGAVELTPIEVTQMYHSLASGGERSPLRAIREVMDQQGNVLNRYPLSLKKVADPEATYLITMSLNEVAIRGTARSLLSLQKNHGPLAGKTGTTNDLRDSWFAGYSGSHVAVVWVGRDDNKPLGLTGSAAALPVWKAFTQSYGYEPLQPDKPVNVSWYKVDSQNGLLADDGCDSVQWMPFIAGTEPTEYGPCSERKSVIDRVWDWLSE